VQKNQLRDSYATLFSNGAATSAARP